MLLHGYQLLCYSVYQYSNLYPSQIVYILDDRPGAFGWTKYFLGLNQLMQFFLYVFPRIRRKISSEIGEIEKKCFSPSFLMVAAETVSPGFWAFSERQDNRRSRRHISADKMFFFVFFILSSFWKLIFPILRLMAQSYTYFPSYLSLLMLFYPFWCFSMLFYPFWCFSPKEVCLETSHLAPVNKSFRTCNQVIWYQ